MVANERIPDDKISATARTIFSILEGSAAGSRETLPDLFGLFHSDDVNEEYITGILTSLLGDELLKIEMEQKRMSYDELLANRIKVQHQVALSYVKQAAPTMTTRSAMLPFRAQTS